jgi:hypothetical protein
MPKSIDSDIRKKRPQGRPRIDATPVMVRMPPAELEVVDLWIRGRPQPRPSRPEAIRRLVELGLTVKPKSATTGRLRAARASDLAAKVIDTLTPGGTDVEEKAGRKRRLLKGPEEFREVRVDRAKNK